MFRDRPTVKDEFITFRCDARTKDLVTRLAKARGTTISRLLTDMLRKGIDRDTQRHEQLKQLQEVENLYSQQPGLEEELRQAETKSQARIYDEWLRS